MSFIHNMCAPASTNLLNGWIVIRNIVSKEYSFKGILSLIIKMEKDKQNEKERRIQDEIQFFISNMSPELCQDSIPRCISLLRLLLRDLLCSKRQLQPLRLLLSQRLYLQGPSLIWRLRHSEPCLTKCGC